MVLVSCCNSPPLSFSIHGKEKKMIANMHIAFVCWFLIRRVNLIFKAAPSTSISPSPSPNNLSITHFPSLDPATFFANNNGDDDNDPHACNVCTPQADSTPRNPEAGSAYRLSPQSPESKEARNKLWGITTHIQAKGSKFP